jgi:hypothetical protein
VSLASKSVALWLRNKSEALRPALPGWGMSSLGPRTRRAMLSHAALLVRPSNLNPPRRWQAPSAQITVREVANSHAAKKGPSFLSFPGRTYPTLATPERHFVRSALNQRSEVAASASADFFTSPTNPRCRREPLSLISPTNPCHRRRMPGWCVLSGASKKRDLFAAAATGTYQATRHATAWRGGCAVPERTHHPGSLREPLSLLARMPSTPRTQRQ